MLHLPYVTAPDSVKLFFWLIYFKLANNLRYDVIKLTRSSSNKSRSSSNSKTTTHEQRSGDLASERLTWKSFDGVVGNPEIRLEGLKCINLSSDTISGIPTCFLI